MTSRKPRTPRVDALQSALLELGHRIAPDEHERGVLGPSTLSALTSFQIAFGAEPTGVLDDETFSVVLAQAEARRTPKSSRKPAPHVVTGTLRDRNGTPLADAPVRAFDKSLTGEQPLGEPAKTNAQGHYSIAFPWPHRHDRGGPALIVRAYARKGKKEGAVAESEVLFNAPRAAKVDLMVGGGTWSGPSELEQLHTKVAPLLDHLPVGELSKEQVNHLSRQTGSDAQSIQLLVWAHKRGQEHGLSPEALFAMARAGLPTSMPVLLAHRSEDVRQALEQAVAQNVVPLRVKGEIEQFVDAFQAAAVEESMKPSADPCAPTPGDILRTAGLDTALQQAFVGRYLEHRGPTQALWMQMVEDERLAPHVPRIQLTIQLTAVARGHLPLVEALQEKATELTGLAKLTERELSDLVARHGFPPDVPGANNDEKAANYVATLSRTLEILIPTALVAERIQSDEVLGKPQVREFFNRHPQFDLARDHVESFLARHPTADVDQPKLAASLSQLQRVFRLTPRYADMRYLIERGLDSAQAVASMGRATFLEAHAQALGGEARANDIFDRARQIAATAALLFARYSPQVNAFTPAAIPQIKTGA